MPNQDNNDFFERVDSEESYRPSTGNSVIESMTKDIEDLCEQLYQSNSLFEIEDAFKILIKCISGEKRILYSQVTLEVFSCYSNHPADEVDRLMNNLSTNLNKMIDYTYKDVFIEKIKQLKREPSRQDEVKALENSRKVLFKLWDHTNLAHHQYEQLKQSDEEFQEKFNDRFTSSFETSSKAKLDQFSKDMNEQLLTLVGIFTALAFMVFGSITGLVNIFSNTTVSVLKLMILGCVWGIAVLNLVFVFLFCVGKMTKTKFASTDDSNASIWLKYPIVWWSNFTIGSILLASMWIYYLKNRDGLSVIDHLLQAYPMKSVVIGSVAIVLMIVFASMKLISMTSLNKGKTDQCDKSNTKDAT